MSGHTLLSAHDAIEKLAADVLNAQSVTVVYADVPLTAAQQAIIEGTTNPVKSWARIDIKDNLRSQETLGGVGQRRFENKGIVIVEVYTPSFSGRTLADTLSALVRDAYEGINVGSLWFRNARTVPAAPDGFWNHTNVIAEFIWDEVK